MYNNSDFHNGFKFFKELLCEVLAFSEIYKHIQAMEEEEEEKIHKKDLAHKSNMFCSSTKWGKKIR